MTALAGKAPTPAASQLAAQASVAAPPLVRNPRKTRLAALVFLAVYPLVTVLMMGLMPLTPNWPLPLRTLVMVPVVVISMVWAIIPFIMSRLRHLL